jgi:broad specificity phosphatase PhoE
MKDPAVFRPLTVLIAVVASATLAGCGTTAHIPPGTTAPSSGTAVAGATVAPAPTPPASDPDVLMIIRHGEKPDGEEPGLDAAGAQDDSSLTTVGWQRAHALVGLFDPAQGDPRAGLARPTTIYAAGATDDGEGQRTRETVAPLAEALGIPVDTEYGKGDEDKLVEKILAQPGPTLISWQHGEIPAIAEELTNVSPAPPEEWPSERFDVVWTFTRTADGWHFTQTPELVLPQDHDGVIEN